MNYCKTMEMYQQQIENLRIEKEELEEVVTALELDYDELADENDELKLLLYRLHQVIGDISEHFEEYSHLCRTLFGVCTTAAPHLDAHKRRTVKGLVKKTGEQGQELNVQRQPDLRSCCHTLNFYLTSEAHFFQMGIFTNFFTHSVLSHARIHPQNCDTVRGAQQSEAD
jgi:hypothetical protein